MILFRDSDPLNKICIISYFFTHNIDTQIYPLVVTNCTLKVLIFNMKRPNQSVKQELSSVILDYHRVSLYLSQYQYQYLFLGTSLYLVFTLLISLSICIYILLNINVPINKTYGNYSTINYFRMFTTLLIIFITKIIHFIAFDISYVMFTILFMIKILYRSKKRCGTSQI